jgi:hypothetical protein
MGFQLRDTGTMSAAVMSFALAVFKEALKSEMIDLAQKLDVPQKKVHSSLIKLNVVVHRVYWSYLSNISASSDYRWSRVAL